MGVIEKGKLVTLNETGRGILRSSGILDLPEDALTATHTVLAIKKEEGLLSASITVNDLETWFPEAWLTAAS